ncbi:hypothetical protein [Streptomyces sp. NBC_01768]|uniref:hypothetical protein n=1 Tax=Streptomyces sp. NBC_01768 TaxID=2975938 RepID=UPI002DD8B404|nr:hypothetical protein [Streptomyces sp. NBC_01768]WSC32133.1 hypothetical protein OG902_38650 [Streptomyces sp. NBC_01768]
MVAADIADLAQELLSGQTHRTPLALRFRQAQLLQREITCFVSAMMWDERAGGESWARIAEAAEVPEASARACWNETKVAGVLAARPARPRFPRRAVVPGQPLDWLFTQPTGRMQQAASQLLGKYLKSLWEGSPVALTEVAHRSDLPRDAITLILGGKLVASWPVTHMVVTILGGSPEAVRNVWEMACQGAGEPWSAAEAERRLRDILSLVRLAGEVSSSSRPGTRARRDSNDADTIPDWPTTAELSDSLALPPSVVRPFWDAWDQVCGREAGH